MVLGQFQAVLVAYGIAALGTLTIALLLKSLGCNLTVEKSEEEAGLDISEHGEEAYVERTGSPNAT